MNSDIVIGLNEKQKSSENGFGIFPNPSGDVIWVSGLSGKEELVLFDCTGSEVFRQKTANDVLDKKTMLGIKNLPKGLYFLNVISENNPHSTLGTKLKLAKL